MPGFIGVVNGIASAVGIEVVRSQAPTRTKIGKIVRRNKPTGYIIVVSAFKVIEAKVAIVVISAIPERIFRRTGASAALVKQPVYFNFAASNTQFIS